MLTSIVIAVKRKRDKGFDAKKFLVSLNVIPIASKHFNLHSTAYFCEDF